MVVVVVVVVVCMYQHVCTMVYNWFFTIHLVSRHTLFTVSCYFVHQATWCEISGDSPASASQYLGILDFNMCTISDFYTCSGDLNLGSQPCVASVST